MIDRNPTPDDQVEQPMPECWRTIGVGGDKSCPELDRFIHCRNCPVLARAARTFFERGAPPGYLESWRGILEEPTEAVRAEATSVLMFRVAGEWLALPTSVLVEVTPVRTLHSVPHRDNSALAGLVNIRGQLQLCMSIHTLLGLEGGPARHPIQPPAGEGADLPRLIVVEQESPEGSERWVLGVDDVAGVHRVTPADLRPVPSTVSHAAARVSSALFEWQGRTVALLDEVRLFDGLRGMVSP